MSREYSRNAIIKKINISDFVKDQYRYVEKKDYTSLDIPKERVYPVKDNELIKQLELSL